MRPPFAPKTTPAHDIVALIRHGVLRCRDCNSPIVGAVSTDEGRWIGGVHQDDYDNGLYIERAVDEFDNKASDHELAGRPLTFREVEILQAVADLGTEPRFIAARVGGAPATILNHLRQIRVKVGAKTTTHAVAIALRDGLIR